MSRRAFAGAAPELARRLLGALLVHDVPAGGASGRAARRRSGRIVEVEAYLSKGDPGSHAWRGPTARNAAMFGAAGTAYVYRIYGLHHCFNVVAGPAGRGEAVLVRALEPLEGVAAMARARRSGDARSLCRGPGRLVEALGIGPAHDGCALWNGPLRVEFAAPLPPHRVVVGRRVGLGRGRDLALRFGLRDSAFLSRPLR